MIDAAKTKISHFLIGVGGRAVIVVLALACCHTLAGGCGAPERASVATPRAALSSSAGASTAPTVASPTTAVAPRPAGPVLFSPADLDRMLEETWRAAHLTPAPPSDDAEFLRRVTLDVAGRVPTLDESERFLASPGAPDKRIRLVDELLASPDYAEHQADVYLDLFVGRQFRKPQLEKRLNPRSYFVGAFAENRGFDRIAREMLTFKGEIQPNGPGVFLASHLKGGGPEVAAAVTARLFMGVQLQCAQCHDHPTDSRYKQEDFFGLVAYFARTKDREERRVGAGAGPMSPDSISDGAALAGQTEPKDPKAYLIIEAPRGQAKFKRPGATVETVAPPRFFGRTVPPLAGETPRETLARAVIGSDLFAKAVVDRTWADLFGRGIVDPWDDLGGEDDPQHPRLLNRLAADFRVSGFDVKHLLRTLLLSRAYGLTSRVVASGGQPGVTTAPPPPTGAGPAAPGGESTDTSGTTPVDPTTGFARASVRRMTPEQLFRSLMVATGAEHMDRAGSEEMDKKITRLLRECLFVFGDDEMAEVNTFNGNVPQALLLWNGEIVNQGARSRAGGTLARILDESADPETRLRRMFMAAYTRPFTGRERERLLPALLPKASRAAYEDLFFAMLTSSEMLTVH